MKLKALKIKDGGVTVKWTQESHNGVEAKWQCTDAVKPQDALAPAMVAVVPHVAAMLGIDPTIREQCAFAAMTVSEKEDRVSHDTYTLCQIIIALPSPGDKPAAAKTDRFDIESVAPAFENAITALIAQGLVYARLSCAARDAVTQ